MSALTRADVVLLARKSLELEDESEELPEWYLSAYINHVTQAPNDTNFIVEFAKPGRGSGVGGNGFGIATCLEDYCWSDVRLGADPALPDGGRSHGFGSLWEYQNHCDSDDHRKGREERCRKTNKSYLPYNPAAAPLVARPAAPAAPVAGPSRSASNNGLGAAASSISAGSSSALPRPASSLSASGTTSVLDRLEALSRPSSSASTSAPSAARPSIGASTSAASAARAGPSGTSSGSVDWTTQRTGSGPAASSSSASGSGSVVPLRPTSVHNVPDSVHRGSTSLGSLGRTSSLPKVGSVKTEHASPARFGAGSGSAGTPSSSRPSRPAYVEVLSSGEEADTDVITLNEAPEHMRKKTNEARPILVMSDSSDDDAPVAGPSSSARMGLGSSQASQGSKGKGKGKQALFRSGSGMGGDSRDVFAEMMSSSQPKVKKEREIDLGMSSLGRNGPSNSLPYRLGGITMAASAPSTASLAADVKPDPAKARNIQDLIHLISLERAALDRLTRAQGKGYLKSTITRRRNELTKFEALPIMYHHIPSTLIAQDPGYKMISKMAEYRRLVGHTGLGGITAADLNNTAYTQPSMGASTSASAVAGPSRIPVQAPTSQSKMREMKTLISRWEIQVLNDMLLRTLPSSISDKVVKRRTDLLNLDTASTVPYVAVDAELVSSDTSGQYKTIVESEKYKKLLGQSTAGAPQQTLAGSVAAGAYSIPAAGSSSAGASGPSQAKIDEEVKAARETTIKEEQKVLNRLLAKNPNGRLRTLIGARERNITLAIAAPHMSYPVISQQLILADQSHQFRMLSRTMSYRIATAWHSKENLSTLFAQIEQTDESMPGAFPRTAGAGSSNTSFGVLSGIAADITNLAKNSPGGVFDPYNGMPMPAYAVPAPPRMPVQHGVDCDCGEFCQVGDGDDFIGARNEIAPENMATFLQESFKDFSDDSTIDDALVTLGMANKEAKFADMTVQLMPHQILGVAFMLEKEKDRFKRGGLLCDAMGLGKTVQTIATIAGNQSQDRTCKTTLIIAPLAVLTQWKSEIESKTAPGLFSVLIYHGTNKPKSRNALKNADVVLTTYGTMANESGIQQRKKRGYKDDPEDKNSDDSDYDHNVKQGILFSIKWFRIVLDEAHVIRNRGTKASKAVDLFKAVHRWCLTGTLVNNSLTDVFPHLRFLGISPQKEWSEFSKFIGRVEKKRPALASRRVQAILRTCMMRRHKDSMLNGQRLLNLPPKTSAVVELEFTEEERHIYDAIEGKMKLRFGQFLRAGTVLKHLSCVLVMLMRLRQLTCHPWLLRRNPGDPAHPNDFEISDNDIFRSLNVEPVDTAADLERAIKLLGQDWVDDMSKRLRERYDRMVNAPKQDEEADREAECSICMEPFTEEVVTECKHSYCKACIHEIFENAPRDAADLNEMQAEQGARKCPLCRGVIARDKTFAALAFFDAEKEFPAIEGGDEMDWDMDVKPNVDRKGKRKSTAADDDDDYETDVKPGAKKLNKGKGKAKDEDEEGEVNTRPDEILPSTKMTRLGELLDQYLAEPGIKVIVFSEFVSYLDLVSVYLGKQDIAHESYTGKMRQGDREDVVRRFTSTEDVNGPRVLLISRKAGGAGLNLTAASKVISLDLAWNAASENQAVDRAHRIGQTRSVEVQRLVIANTVEQRILDLQMKKEALADGAMGEGTGGRLSRLSVADLMRLFDYRNDDNGRDD